MIRITRTLSTASSRKCHLIGSSSTRTSTIQKKPSASFYHASTKNSAKGPPSKSPPSSKKSGKPAPTTPAVSSTSTSTATANNAANKQEMDPHEIASRMVYSSSDSRIAGTEALNSLSTEAKLRNYATALVLAGFCTGVWWYSIQAVGKSEGGIEDLLAEANDAKEGREEREISDGKMEELAGLDVTMSQMSGDMEGVEVAVAAEAEIAQMEEDMHKAANQRPGSGKKPLW
eukprot:CAMPEP_0198251778 /NCGR_PEP_ID=MMETSP1447-20131203/2504_1 /TAXON_ID=420782 /ORGANISM="Chaetoceros dichaeta, Strain CCMP1751" /LENGTH=230 /DNA_ID=CAMNT_0043936879 /DNA_START=24 /DNA_END=713 /DNA_ORIENTATION=+